VETLLEEELYVIVPKGSTLVPDSKASLTLAETAALPLIVPSPGYGLRRQIMAEFERANLHYEAVAEIDSLLLSMRYSAKGHGVTIQPMAATLALDAPERWRCVPISDVRMSRRSYLYSLPIQQMSAGASIVRAELKSVIARLIETRSWTGVTLLDETDPGGAASAPAHRARSAS